VWDEVQLPGKPTYFLDVTASFLKPQQYERPITPHGLGRLLFEMVAVQGWDLSMPVSNGLNHALVANGGFGARAAVTTALGGPWDAAGVFLVQKAGGAVLGFKNGVRLESGLSVGRGDVFISANSPASAEELAQVVMTSFYPELYP
jgi:fructose-1,6-bisphosphatase/inositol monophosphatase family enzyme